MAVDALGVCGSVGVCARAHIVWCALMCPSMLAFTVCVLPPACSLVSPSLRVLPTAPGRLKWDDWASFGNRNPLSQKQMPFYRVHFSVFCFFFLCHQNVHLAVFLARILFPCVSYQA